MKRLSFIAAALLCFVTAVSAAIRPAQPGIGGGGSTVSGSITGAYSFNGPFSVVNATNVYLSAVLSNQVVTGISVGATNASAYVGSSGGKGTNIDVYGTLETFGTDLFFGGVAYFTNSVYMAGDLQIIGYANVADELDALQSRQGGSALLTNFTLMGITNITSANANLVVTTNTGVLVLTASGGAGSPGGTTTTIQYNQAGAFAGSSNFVYDQSIPAVDIWSTTVNAAIAVGYTNGTSGTTNKLLRNGVWMFTPNGSATAGMLITAAGVIGGFNISTNAMTPQANMHSDFGSTITLWKSGYFGSNIIAGGSVTVTNSVTAQSFIGSGTGVPILKLQTMMSADNAFAISVRTNFTQSTTNFFEVTVTNASAGQAMVLHSAAAGQLVWTNGAVAGTLGTTNPIVVYRDNALLDWSNTTSETTNLTYTIPAGQLGTDRSLRFSIAGYCTNQTVSRTLRIRVYLGSTTLFDQTSAAIGVLSTNAWNLSGSVTANNSQSAQSLDGAFLLSATTTAGTGYGQINTDEQASISPLIGFGTEDTASAKNLTVTLTWNNTGDAFARRVKSQLILE